jgi:hypothetical protein
MELQMRAEQAASLRRDALRIGCWLDLAEGAGQDTMFAFVAWDRGSQRWGESRGKH